jgi:hemolysin activation/secretion protein
MAVPVVAIAQRLGDDREEALLPAQADEEPSQQILPRPSPLPELPDVTVDPLHAGSGVRVDRFDVSGSTAFDAATLANTLSPWTGRAIRSEELLAARDAINALYREEGYATSGALIPDQQVVHGVVRIHIVEGSLTEVSVSGARHFRPIYFEHRLRLAGRAPLRVQNLERALRILQRNEWVRRVDARLEPGERIGESRLVLVIEETARWKARATVANDHSPSVGSFGVTTHGELSNLLGLGDVWSGHSEWTEGVRDIEARFEMSITPWDTRLGLRFRDTKTEVIEKPFDRLDIEASSRTWSVSLAQPLYRRLKDEVWLEVVGERRSTESRVLGLRFCFELTGPDCDTPVVSVLRLAVDWTRRTRSDVIALRSQVSIGLDVLGATTVGDPDIPDGSFVAWLAQAQWVHVLPERLLASHLVLRGDAQLTDSPMLAIEKLAMGGRLSVRGYRENQLVRDNGFSLSGELRVPVWRDSLRRHVVELVPFMDFAQGWNNGPATLRRELWSVGIGLRWLPRDGILGEFYWGEALEKVDNPNHDLQDDGIHLRISIDAATFL